VRLLTASCACTSFQEKDLHCSPFSPNRVRSRIQPAGRLSAPSDNPGAAAFAALSPSGPSRRWVNSTLADKERGLLHSRWPIAISYHCPVAAVRARAPWTRGGAMGPAEGERGTKKGQMAPSSSQPSGSGHAPTESEHLPLLPRRRAQENHRLLLARQKAHPPADTNRQSRLSRAQFLISYLSRVDRVRRFPLHSSLRCIRFLSSSIRPAPRFSILADGTCRAHKDHPFLFPSLSASASFVKSRLDKTTRARQTRKLQTSWLVGEERHVSWAMREGGGREGGKARKNLSFQGTWRLYGRNFSLKNSQVVRVSNTRPMYACNVKIIFIFDTISDNIQGKFARVKYVEIV